MYPRNAAAPEPIAIGPVIQISDGAVQTSGCTVRIKPIGVAEANGAGTTSYSTDGIVYYTPTQAETNYTSFILIATKAACIPTAITIITTASETPGTVLLAPVTHTSAVIPTVTNLTNLPAITNNWITAAGIATDALGASAVSAAAANKIADHSRRRTQANIEASSDGDAVSLGSEYGLIQQAQESAAAGTTLTVYKTDGTTSLGTKTLTGNPTADPITAIQ